MASSCAGPGETNSDVAGLGILIAFILQGGLALVLALYMPASILFARGTDKPDPDRPLRVLRTVIVALCDVQSFAGISLLVAALSQHRTLTLYHYRFVYDVVSFTGVSFTASLLSEWMRHDRNKPNKATQELINWMFRAKDKKGPHWKQVEKRPRLDRIIAMAVSQKLILLIFTALYIAFSVLFGRKLQNWSNNEIGSCYFSTNIAKATDQHPRADLAYFASTCALMGIALTCCIIFTPSCVHLIQCFRTRNIPDTDQVGIVGSAILTLFWLLCMQVLLTLIAIGQFVVHTYMAVYIRSTNKAHLTGDSEDSWGFGQVVPLVLLIPIMRQLGTAYVESSPLQDESSGEEAQSKSNA